MGQVTDDVWILIFREYLEDPSTMSISLTPVCRHWYNLIKATPSLWFRVILKLKRNVDIPPIISSKGLADYLSRGDGLNIPLDIEVRFCEPPTKEHRSICGTKAPLMCRKTGCQFISVRQTLLKALFHLLADKEPLPNEHEAGSEPESEPRLRINRWRTFSFECKGIFGKMMGDYGGFWSMYPFPCAPRLSHLTFQCVPIWFEPVEACVPSLTNVTIRDVQRDWNPRIINIPSLKYLSLQSNIALPWDDMGGICTVEELEVAEHTFLWGSSANIDFPNLKRLKIRKNAGLRLLSHLSKEFEISNRRLDVIHLVKYDLFPLHYNPGGLSILTNARRIVLEIQAERQLERSRVSDSEESDEPPSLEKLLDLCALDTEVVTVDEEYATALAVAREAVLQKRTAHCIT